MRGMIDFEENKEDYDGSDYISHNIDG